MHRQELIDAGNGRVCSRHKQSAIGKGSGVPIEVEYFSVLGGRPRVGPLITHKSGPTGSSSWRAVHGSSCSQPHSVVGMSLLAAVAAGVATAASQGSAPLIGAARGDRLVGLRRAAGVRDGAGAARVPVLRGRRGVAPGRRGSQERLLFVGAEGSSWCLG